MQLSQQVGGLRGELAALQAEKDDLINTCQQQKTDLHTTRSDLEQHKSKLQKQEEIESQLRKNIEQLEVHLTLHINMVQLSHARIDERAYLHQSVHD